MESSDKAEISALVGRFVLEIGGERRIGLAAHEVVSLLESVDGGRAKVYRIHRVDDAGRMELVGVAGRAFTEQDCLIFSRRRLEDARSDFASIRAAATGVPPPCRVEMEVAEAFSPASPFVVVLIFPAPCGEAVGQWLVRLGLHPGDVASGGTGALRSYRDGSPQVVDRVILQVVDC